MDDHTPLWGQYIELKYPDVIIWFKSKSAQEQKAILSRGKLKLSQITEILAQVEALIYQLFPNDINSNNTKLTSQKEWFTVTKRAITDIKFEGLKLHKLHQYLCNLYRETRTN